MAEHPLTGALVRAGTDKGRLNSLSAGCVSISWASNSSAYPGADSPVTYHTEQVEDFRVLHPQKGWMPLEHVVPAPELSEAQVIIQSLRQMFEAKKAPTPSRKRYRDKDKKNLKRSKAWAGAIAKQSGEKVNTRNKDRISDKEARKFRSRSRAVKAYGDERYKKPRASKRRAIDKAAEVGVRRSGMNPFKYANKLGPAVGGRKHDRKKQWKCGWASKYVQKCVKTGSGGKPVKNQRDGKKLKPKIIRIKPKYKKTYNQKYYKWKSKKGGPAYQYRRTSGERKNIDLRKHSKKFASSDKEARRVGKARSDREGKVQKTRADALAKMTKARLKAKAAKKKKTKK